MSEVGVAYVNIIPKAEGFSSSVAEASKEAGTAGANSIKDSLLGTLKGTFGDMFSTGGEMGSKLSSGMESFLSGAGKMAIMAAVAAIGVEALRQLEEIGAEIDEMADAIIIGTGATGEELDALNRSAIEVSTSVPVGFAKSGDIIQDFNTRLGLSGESLQSVAEHAAELDYIVGGFNYDNMATMFNVWGVGADEMNTKMDYMWGVAQNTGIGFDKLTGIMQSSGPTLQNLGFTFEQSANMAGLLDKNGIDASSTMSRLSRALVELSEPGEDAQETFRRTVDQMQAYIDAGDTASAMDIAQELFGTRGAAQFVAALQSGALSMDELSNSALGATGNIDETYESIKSWPETWALIQTRVQAALEPLGSAVFSALGGILDNASMAMDGLWQASEPLRTKLSELASGIGDRLAPVVEALSPLFDGLAGGAMAVVSAAFEHLAGIVDFVGGVFSSVWDGVIAPFANWFESTFGDEIATGAGIIRGIFEDVRGFIEGPVEDAKNFVQGIPDEIVGFFSGLGDRITEAIGSIHFPQPHVGSTNVDIAGVTSVKLPTVEWYASGGFVNGATLIGAGEAGPEMILPAQGGLMDDFADAVASQVDTAAVVDEIRRFRREIGPIIADYAPGMTQREFNRAARTAVAYG